MTDLDEKLRGEWFWGDRWVTSSGFLLPIAARGLYREMLTAAWLRGARLPNDEAAIRRAVGVDREEWAALWPAVSRYWRVDGAWLVNDTQLDVYAKCRAEVEAKRRRAKAGADARWKPEPMPTASSGSAQAVPEQSPPDQDQTPDQDRTQEPTPVAAPRPQGAPRRRPQAAGLIARPGAWGTAHSGHVVGFCDWMCLPSELATQFASRLPVVAGASGAEAEVLAWARGVRQAFEADGRVPTGRMFDFWNARWQEAHGDSQAATKGVDILAGVKGVLRRG